MTYDSFLVTHNELRNIDTFNFFVKRFKDGLGFLSREQKISFIKTEDGKIYLWDGHHEVAAAFYCGANLESATYIIKERTYEQLESINFSCSFVTPFNPRTHVRKADFQWFKEAIINIREGWREHNSTKEFVSLCQEWARSAILDFPNTYREERKVSHIKDIVPCEPTM